MLCCQLLLLSSCIFAVVVASVDVGDVEVRPGETGEDLEALADLTCCEPEALEPEGLVAGDLWTSSHPIQHFDEQLNSVVNEAEGLYYEFATASSQRVWSGQVEGRPGWWATASTAFPLASVSKLFTGFAAMYTMELKPRQFFPEKFVHEFKGWERFRDFPVHGTSERANLTLHHLLTHTSGLPFGLRDSKSDIEGMTLFFRPGTAFGYTLGHRVIGWLLRDFWSAQPEARGVPLESVQDTFQWLIFEKLGLSPATRFDPAMSVIFGYSGEAADAAIQSSGEDFMKLAVVALRRGRLPSGLQLISEENWNKWAVPNLLPGGKLSEALVSWQAGAASWEDWNVGGLKEKIMKQSGPYGWNYFGSTAHNSTQIGWCGFFSSCLFVAYPEDLAVVMMQRDIADLKHSKPYLRAHLRLMALSLQCSRQSCGASTSVFCETSEGDAARSTACPSLSIMGKLSSHSRAGGTSHSCYVPFCRVHGASCRQDTGGSCQFLGCYASRGPTRCVNGRCLCAPGACASAGQCLRPPYGAACLRSTGGSCKVLGCGNSRGPTECEDGACFCAAGFCARAGRCMSPPVISPCERDTGGSCLVWGCDASRGATDCVHHRCRCKAGFCAVDGRCVGNPVLVNNSFLLAEEEMKRSPAVRTPLLMAGSTSSLLLLAVAAFMGKRLHRRGGDDAYVRLLD